MGELKHTEKYELMYKHQEGKCFYCMFEFEYKDMTKDHFFPKSKGGLTFGNIVLSCSKCNKEKESESIHSFMGNTRMALIAALSETNKDQEKILRLRNIIKRCLQFINHPERFISKMTIVTITEHWQYKTRKQKVKVIRKVIGLSRYSFLAGLGCEPNRKG